MSDETTEDADELGPIDRPEGVRIVGAQEASSAASPATPAGGEPTGSVPRIIGATPASGEAAPTTASEPVVVSSDPDQAFELPHYAEPPTGQVPKVVIGEDSDSRWAGLGDQPRWRDSDHQFDEPAGFEDLADDAPRLGALGQTGEHRDFFADLDLTEDDEPTVAPRRPRAVSAVDDLAPDLDAESDTDALSDVDEGASPRRPPAPRRRRAPERTGGRPGSGERPGPGRFGGDAGAGRNLPAAAGVGVALLAVGLGCFWLGSLATTILIAVVLCLSAAELFTSLTRSGYRPAGLLGIVAVAGLSVAPLYQGLFAYPVILGLVTLVGLAWFLFVQPGEGAVMNLGVTLLGVLYVGGLGSFASLTLGMARHAERDGISNQGIGVLIAAVLVTVSYDVGAYFVGRSFGQTPLSSASPNKTQEGLLGGVAAGILIPCLILWLAELDPVGVDFKTTIGFTLICALMAPVGDLCESAIKRDLGIKDMGTLLPGHGGVLDRFDAMLFVLPTAYFMAHLLDLGQGVAF